MCSCNKDVNEEFISLKDVKYGVWRDLDDLAVLTIFRLQCGARGLLLNFDTLFDMCFYAEHMYPIVTVS